MSAPELVVTRSVVVDMVRLAAEESPGVLRVGHGGPPWRAPFRGAPISVRLDGRHAAVRIVLVARPGHPLPSVCAQVRASVAGACERLLGLDPAAITIRVDGVGA